MVRNIRNTFDINFYCRASKVNKKGEAHIEMSITLNGKRVFINLPLMVTVNEFSKKRQPAYIADYLTSMRTNVQNAVTDISRRGMPLTVDSIREYIRDGGVKNYDIQTLINDYLTIQRKRIGKELTQEHYDKFPRTFEILENYVKLTDPVTVITPRLMTNIYTDLKVKYKLSTAAGYATRLKALMTYAMDNALLTINPFQGIKISKGVNEIEILSAMDFNNIRTKEIAIERLSKVRDIFILQCSTGMAYCDLIKLKNGDIEKVNDTYVIRKKRSKTGTDFCAVILPSGVEVLEKYNWDIKQLMISNQKLNAYLKEVGDICGVKSVKGLHSHLARHFYCNYLVNSGIRVETVAKAVGHTNTKTTLKYYAKVSDETTVNEISNLFK